MDLQGQDVGALAEQLGGHDHVGELPEAALEAAKWVEMVRVNPGNYADTKKFAIKEYSDDQYTADIMTTILGGGRSSRLYRTLREEKRLVYSVGASFWSNRGSGVTICSGVFAPEKENKVIHGIITMDDILSQLVSIAWRKRPRKPKGI